MHKADQNYRKFVADWNRALRRYEILERRIAKAKIQRDYLAVATLTAEYDRWYV